MRGDPAARQEDVREKGGPHVTEAVLDLSALRKLVDLHDVGYEVYPDRIVAQGEVRTVGFEIQLLGTHAHGSTRLTPGCELCANTWSDLRRIAEWIIPDGPRESRFDIQPFDGALHMAPSRGLRPEVALSLMIQHKHMFDAPLDDCELKCLREIEQRFQQIGARRLT